MGLKIGLVTMVTILLSAFANAKPYMLGGKPMSIALAHLKVWEGCRLQVYTCAGGVQTIGYGCTAKAMVAKKQISQAEADLQLKKDIVRAQYVVVSSVKVPLTAGQEAALISFVFNVGSKNFKSSTLLKKLNAGDYASVPGQLRRWKYAGGKVCQGLINRREAEIKLWQK